MLKLIDILKNINNCLLRNSGGGNQQAILFFIIPLLLFMHQYFIKWY